MSNEKGITFVIDTCLVTINLKRSLALSLWHLINTVSKLFVLKDKAMIKLSVSNILQTFIAY